MLSCILATLTLTMVSTSVQALAIALRPVVTSKPDSTGGSTRSMQRDRHAPRVRSLYSVHFDSLLSG
ncbi:hypothetical protein FHT10_001771 [Xanthomonas arboricola]